MNSEFLPSFRCAVMVSKFWFTVGFSMFRGGEGVNRSFGFGSSCLEWFIPRSAGKIAWWKI